MKTNDLKKGTRIELACGWFATLVDNRKGNTRIADVEGDFREMGSVYSHDIIRALVEKDGQMVWVLVEHTANQLKCKARARGWL